MLSKFHELIHMATNLGWSNAWTCPGEYVINCPKLILTSFKKGAQKQTACFWSNGTKKACYRIGNALIWSAIMTWIIISGWFATKLCEMQRMFPDDRWSLSISQFQLFTSFIPQSIVVMLIRHSPAQVSGQCPIILIVATIGVLARLASLRILNDNSNGTKSFPRLRQSPEAIPFANMILSSRSSARRLVARTELASMITKFWVEKSNSISQRRVNEEP
jgi:hypothetical protein